MGEIYRNATATIAAARAEHIVEGILQGENQIQFKYRAHPLLPLMFMSPLANMPAEALYLMNLYTNEPVPYRNAFYPDLL